MICFVTRSIVRKVLGCLLLVSLNCSGVRASVEPSTPGRAERILANGMHVVAIRNTLAPVVSTWMTYFVGSDDDGETPGLAHAAEHMMFRGSRSVSGPQFADTVAMMGGQFNGETGPDATFFYLQVPLQDLDVAMHLEASRSGGVLDDAGTWEPERGAITQEVLMRKASAGYRISNRVAGKILAGSVYSNDTLGTVGGFSTLSASEIRSFHERFYTPSNALYVIVGDVDPIGVLERVDKIFGAIPGGEKPTHDAPPNLPPTSVDGVIKDEVNALPATYSVFGFGLPGTDSSDYSALRVLFDVLGNIRGPLERQLIGDHNLLTLSTSVRHFRKASVGFIGASIKLGPDYNVSIKNIKDAISLLGRNGIDDADVRSAKLRLRTEAALEESSISAEAQTWSRAIALEGRSPIEDDAEIAAVTAADVNRCLENYVVNVVPVEGLALSNSSGPVARIDPNSAESGALLRTSVHPRLPVFAQHLFDVTPLPFYSTPEVSVLPNGLRLITFENAGSTAVTVRGAVNLDRDDVPSPKFEAVDAVLQEIFKEGEQGSGSTAKLDELGATIDVGISFGFDLEASQFEKGIAHLAESELHPQLNEAALEKASRRVANEAASVRNLPEVQSENALCSALYGANNARCLLASSSSIAMVDHTQVSQRFEDRFRPERTTIVVVGNISKQRAYSVIANYFGKWEMSNAQSSDRPAIAPLSNIARDVVIQEKGRVQSKVTLAQIIPITRASPDYVALRVANALLTGGMFGSYLYEDLREQTGYVYSVSSRLQPNRDDILFEIGFASNPRSVETSENLIGERLKVLRDGPIQEPIRIERAKALLLSDLSLSSESLDSIANRTLYYSSFGLPPDTGLREARAVKAITADDIKRVFARYIKPDGFVRLVEAPALEQQ